MRNFPIYRQLDAMDCGPTCISMISKYHGKEYSLEYLRALSYLTREGVSLLGISEAAEKIGYKTLAVKADVKKISEDAPLPCVLHWNQNHFVVLYKIKNGNFHIADPGEGKMILSRDAFEKYWMGSAKNKTGIALLLEPTQLFYTVENKDEGNKKGFRFLFRYLRPYYRYMVQLFVSILIGSALSLIFPFLTQSIVDYGINRQNISFVSLMLISQLVLFAGSTTIEIIRGWLLLHMNNRISISIISDFLIKLMRLPINFFDTMHMGDIKQRIADHQRIQSFLTGTTLSTLFSFINLIIFTFVLAFYSTKILLIFASFSILGGVWIALFLKKRKQLDYARFQQMSDKENVLIELITGMQEIKLNNCERTKRWGWENMQTKIFKLNMKSMALGQHQQIGSGAFNQLKNIFITYISATEVINGHMTLGMMMSVSYIIGQLNSPVQQLLGLVQATQDAKISLDRLSEIHNRENEEASGEELSRHKVGPGGIIDDNLFSNDEPSETPCIKLDNVSYQYQGPRSPYVLKNINLQIPKGKVTAIVGTSGSGKTTLLKLLLRFYDPISGTVSVDGEDIKNISPSWWRSKCGTVMQEGYIFSDSIAGNISLSDEIPDDDKLHHAVKVANIQKFIEELPLKFNTKIGNTGNGISMGQKQRMLIARAVYKNPDYLFFDEATSALDANNEKVIMKNLQEFFMGKTVVVVAHRLSTVKNADQIVVLENGQIVEIGNHQSLVAEKGKYYELVKNQLELGT